VYVPYLKKYLTNILYAAFEIFQKATWEMTKRKHWQHKYSVTVQVYFLQSLAGTVLYSWMQTKIELDDFHIPVINLNITCDIVLQKWDIFILSVIK
jgi:hypothetical protein